MLKKSIVLALALAIVAGCGKKEDSSSGGGGGSSASAKTPEEAYNEMKKCLIAGDGKAIWNGLSAASRKKLTTDPEMLKGQEEMKKLTDEQLEGIAKEQYGVTAAQLRKMSPEEMMIALFGNMAKDPKEKEENEKSKWKSADIKGDKAYCTTTKPGGDGKDEEDYTVLVKEDGTWKVDIEETQNWKKEKKGEHK